MKGLFVGFLTFCFSVAAPCLAAAQDGDQRFRVEVEAVNLLVTVVDKKTGKFVKELTADDFEVYEDGVLQEITNFASETNLPLAIALCIDTSSSVKLKLDFEKEAAIDFLFTVMRPIDQALVAEFDTGVTLLHDFTPNPNDLVREINRLRAGGGTSLYDAIYLVSEQKLLNTEGRRTLIVLSDGADLTSKRSFQEALEMALRAEAVIYAISTTRFGAQVDYEGENALKQLTEPTGGQVFFPFSTSEFTKAFLKIEEELRSQYSITYVPSNRRRDGSFRKITVKVKRDGVEVRHRSGYYAPIEQTVAE
ncbi:MAG TPA: VWA domain-containing protein [Acidobacteriota bacterium]|nr:VWA domain-containing protein [Acidobacteriota bacterium]HRR57489.1 VWA domain-containing protein [Acidobacteriota bacterium]HRV09070.1 VWA domain-containing protein [Acidobacteriota bacterium]